MACQHELLDDVGGRVDTAAAAAAAAAAGAGGDTAAAGSKGRKSCTS